MSNFIGIQNKDLYLKVKFTIIYGNIGNVLEVAIVGEKGCM